MVWPIVAGGVAVVGGLIQLYNAERARGANAKTLKRIEEMINKIESPDFTPEMITPEDYEVVSTLAPQLAPYFEEAKPTIVQESADMLRGRQAQLEALDQLRTRATREMDPAMQARLTQAGMAGQREAQSRQESLLQDAQRRGQLGGGALFAAQLQAGESAMDRTAALAQDAAIEADKARLEAIMQGAQLGGNIYDQDRSTQRTNADIINSYNQRMAAGMNQNLGQNTDRMNTAMEWNARNAQDVANRSVGARNQAQQQNVQNTMAGKKYNWDAEMSKLSQKTGVGYNQINMNTQNTADQNAAIQGIAGGIGATASAFDQAGQRQQDRESNERIAKMRYMSPSDETQSKYKR
jgi:hypothetical protein